MVNPVNEFLDNLFKVDRPVILDLSTGNLRSINGTSLPTVLDKIGSIFHKHNALQGDRVICIFENTLESALLLLAAIRYGITLCVLPAGTSFSDLVQLKTSLRAKQILNATHTHIDNVIKVSLEDIYGCKPVVPPDSLSSNLPLTITFTSGSTGQPKGVIQTAENFILCAHNFNRVTKSSSADKFLNVMPMYYMAGIFNGILAPLCCLATVVICNEFSAKLALTFWRLIESQDITALWLAPAMLSLIMKLDRRQRKTETYSLKHVFVGTGPLLFTEAQNFYHTYGLTPINSYGLSELLFVSVDDPDCSTLGTVGKLLPGVSITCLPDQPLTVKSPYSFLGYLHNEVYTPHYGIFQTSDLGTLSSNGLLSIHGRSDDLIVRGGVNINPLSLESFLAPHIKTQKYCIVGMPDSLLGQKVVLVLEGAPVAKADFAKLQQLIKNKPGKYHLDSFVNIETIPITPTGKIRRSLLKQVLSDF